MRRGAITSLLRSVSPLVTGAFLTEAYDIAVVQAIKGNVLPTFGQFPLDYLMAQVPRREGGMGLRSASRLAPRAYLAGFLSPICRHHIIPPAFSRFIFSLSLPPPPPP